MSYASKKGWQGQNEVKDFLESIFKEFGFKFYNVTGSEKNKKVMAGDVVLDFKSDPDNLCLLEPYFLEAKKQGQPQVFQCYSKAQDDAISWGKRGSILFAIKQKKGTLGPGSSEKIVVMSWKIFNDLIKELQSYRHEQFTKDKSGI
jgi:hypothetical protein